MNAISEYDCSSFEEIVASYTTRNEGKLIGFILNKKGTSGQIDIRSEFSFQSMPHPNQG